MGAHLDSNGKPYFLLGNDGTETARVGASGMLFNRDWAFIENKSPRDDKRESWSACPHLSSLEGLFDYYMASASIMVLLGKCFCHDCYKMVLSRRDLKEFMDSCQHMTDQRF